MDLILLRKELLVAMRGKKSQIRVSQKMGFKSNQVYKWETGRNSMSWLEFLHYASCCGINLDRAIHYILGFKGRPEKVHDLIIFIMGTDDFCEISRRTGFKENLVKKWLRARACPSVDVIFQLLNSVQFILTDFICAIVSIDKVPSLEVIRRLKQQQKSAIFQSPYLEAALACLELDEYRQLSFYPQGYLSKMLGLSEAEEALALAKLQEIGMLKYEQGKYRVIDRYVDTVGTLEGAIHVRRYWLSRIDEMLKATNVDPRKFNSHFGYEIVAVSNEVADKILALYYDFFTKIKALITDQQDHHAQSVKLIAMQILDLPKSTEMIRNRASAAATSDAKTSSDPVKTKTRPRKTPMLDHEL